MKNLKFIRYIISVSDKGIIPEIPDEKSEAMSLLGKRVQNLQRIYPGSWYLSEGYDEKYYTATRPREHPLNSKDDDDLRTAFGKEKRDLDIYKLDQQFVPSEE